MNGRNDDVTSRTAYLWEQTETYMNILHTYLTAILNLPTPSTLPCKHKDRLERILINSLSIWDRLFYKDKETVKNRGERIEGGYFEEVTFRKRSLPKIGEPKPASILQIIQCKDPSHPTHPDRRPPIPRSPSPLSRQHSEEPKISPLKNKIKEDKSKSRSHEKRGKKSVEKKRKRKDLRISTLM